jgi:hypothetical protein
VNREKLEEIAGDSYGPPETEYARLVVRPGDGHDLGTKDWSAPDEEG